MFPSERRDMFVADLEYVHKAGEGRARKSQECSCDPTPCRAPCQLMHNQIRLNFDRIVRNQESPDTSGAFRYRVRPIATGEFDATAFG